VRQALARRNHKRIIRFKKGSLALPKKEREWHFALKPIAYLYMEIIKS
jgi:hypothetical protein